MSVTIEGVKGYEYQYKVTTLISLLYYDYSSELFIESKGSEDALLKLSINDEIIQIEIQVKGEHGNLDIQKLSNWLCHFQERKANNNLLYRITKKDNFIALFVTQSRCTDDTVIFKKKLFDLFEHNKISINKELKNKFIDSLRKITPPKGSLSDKRKSFCIVQSKKIRTIADLKEVLRKVVIWEEISEQKIDISITNLLNTKFHISLTNSLSTYLQLLEVIKEGRNKQNNIVPILKRVIQANKMNHPILHKEYKKRNEEDNLIQKLSSSNILLLTGNTQCGKSEVAKKIAYNFFNQGYLYKITNNITEIQRFFSTNLEDKKLIILEDPWGHTRAENDCIEKYKKVNELLKLTSTEKKIIITTRIEILFDVFETSNLDDCTIQGIEWDNLTITDGNIINDFWLDMSSTKSIPDKIVKLVSSNVINSNGHSILQIGQLNYLANQDLDTLQNKNFEHIQHIARYNSSEIARSIHNQNNYFSEILAVLAFGSTNIYSINLIDLAYILSNDQANLSIIDKSGFSFSPGIQEDSFPEYKTDNIISQENLDALEYLEERQLIEINNNNLIFRHPNYYEAGRSLFFSNSIIRQKRLIEYAKHSLSCLNPKTALTTASQFPFLYKKIRPSLKTEIIDLAFKGLNSIFPSVEDKSLVFLISIIDDLDNDNKDMIIRKLQRGSTDIHNIYWNNNEIAYISTQSNISTFTLLTFNEEHIALIENKLSQNKVCNSYDTWLFLEYYIRSSEKCINREIVKTILHYDEVFIREEVVQLAFKQIDEKNTDIIDIIFKDEHPNVVFKAIKSAIDYWRYYSIKLREYLFPLITTALHQKAIAIRTFNLLSTFSVEYTSESIEWHNLDKKTKNEIWNLWSKLYPIVIDDLPLNLFLNTGRFGATMDKAMQYLSPEMGIPVLEKWLSRIEFKIKNGELPDSYEIAIADNLMQLTKNDDASRKDIFNKLINFQDTSLIFANISWFTHHWNYLTVLEQNQLLSLVDSLRKDNRWIKAAFLNSPILHKGIQNKLFGDSEVLSHNIEKIISIFPEQLLQDCLNVYCGFPQPLWWLGTHHNNQSFWGKIIRYILLNCRNDSFYICLDEFLSNGVNGFSDDWSDGLTLWEEICNQPFERKPLVDYLIFHTADCSCNIPSAKNLWMTLIDSYKKIDKEDEIIIIIVNNIELLQQTGNKQDLFKIFDNKYISRKILPNLTPDLDFIILFDKVYNDSHLTDSNKIGLVEDAFANTEIGHIRFFATFNYLRNTSCKALIPDEITFLLSNLPDLIEEIGKNELNDKRKLREYQLSDWIFFNEST